MYDLPELRWATDAWWTAVAAALREEGAGAGIRAADIPAALDREVGYRHAWADPDLLLSQMCGYPLMRSFAGRVQLVATPTHSAPGSADGRYTSTVLVPVSSPARTLADLRGLRVAVNEPDSHSGMNALRSLIAPRVAAGRGDAVAGEQTDRGDAATGDRHAFFGEVVWSGAHRASLELLVAGQVDVACIDTVTYVLTADVRPDLVAGLRELACSQPVPAPAYVTRAGATAAEVAALQRALLRAQADADPGVVRARRALRIAGVEILALDCYRALTDLERAAADLGYPTLA